MVELVAGVAVVLLVAGVAGSVLPLLPSGLLSLAGVVVYAVWGEAPIGGPLFVSFVVVGLVTAVLEHFGGALAARASGASTRTMLAAAAAGLVLFVVTGPVGLLVGLFGVVFLAELWDDADPGTATRRAAASVVGVLGSAVAQFVLTLSMLVAFLVFVVL